MAAAAGAAPAERGRDAGAGWRGLGGADPVGRTRRRSLSRVLELRAHGEESRAAGAELEEAAAAAGAAGSGSETASSSRERLAGRNRLGTRWRRARQNRRCSPGRAEEGSRLAGEVGGGGGSGSGCVLGRGRRCVRARPPPLSSCHQQPLLLLQSRAGESGPAAVLPAASISRWPGSRGPLSRPASWVLPATSLVVHAAGRIRPRRCRRTRASATVPPSPHTSEGPHCRLAAFRGPSAAESAPTTAFR